MRQTERARPGSESGAAAKVADVVIAGAGPTGLMLAIELCLGGVRPVVLERLTEISDIPKGNGLVGQIVPMLDYRGLLDYLRDGTTYSGAVPGFSFGSLNLDLARLGASPLHVLAIPQRELELKLGQRLHELGGTVSRGHELIALDQSDDAVTLAVRGPAGEYQIRARYLAGCDGAHSLVRKLAGIGFPGVTSDEVSRIGRVIVPAELIVAGTGALNVPGAGQLMPMQTVRTTGGSYTIGPLAMLDKKAPAGAYIVSTREEDPAAGTSGDGPLTLDELRASVRRVIGADLPMSDPLWLARIVGNSRQAARYQHGRVLVAGDAAHVFGLGGSLNVGLLDAINLGWKLAAEIGGWAPDGLLATYQIERHAAGHRTLIQTRAQKALSAGGEYAQALRDLVGELLIYNEPLRHIGELIEGSDVRYDMTGVRPGTHSLAGRVAPDLRLSIGGNRTRVAELMRAARPVLLDLTPDGRTAATAADWAGRVPVIVAEPLLRPAPADALLIRPDGYVAWAIGPGAADPAAGLREALAVWCGEPG